MVVSVDGIEAHLEILDPFDEHPLLRSYNISTAGQGFILLFSHSETNAYDRITSTHKLIVESRTVSTQKYRRAPIVLVGLDGENVPERQITFKEGAKLTEKLGLNGYFECSWRMDKNIEDPFFTLTRELRKLRGEAPQHVRSLLMVCSRGDTWVGEVVPGDSF